ncbi:TatD family hydrolase [Schumannella soli]|uniref:TatD family deoxyribonuclease n=1 Tax=Schumannella soli TaxID=2590779 RepID=A0A506XSP4_9MICO|nr:TatD family hydrolase [Schumannella soli]TPW75681.1 TatD family deoxyribonuclease [Schumannella soli]
MSDYPPLPEALVVPVYDNHTHLEPSFDPERVGDDGGLGYLEQLDRASSVGVRGVVQVGTDLASSRWSAEVAAREPRVLAAVALHPNDAAELAEAGQLDEHLAGIAELASQPRVRAIGETGLDFFRTPSPVGQDAQRRSFEAHIALAKQHDLALQIHDRDAHAEVVETLDRVGAPERTVFHCFSGDAEFAKLVADRGWYLSFAGTVTFKNAQNLRDALAVIPRSRILIETDAPYLTPTPFRGRPNSSYLIPHTLRFMAAELGTDASMLAAQISSNTELVYGHWDDVPVVTPPGPFDEHPEGTTGP